MNTLVHTFRLLVAALQGKPVWSNLLAERIDPLVNVRLSRPGQRSFLHIDVDHLILDADRIDLAPGWSRRRKSKAGRHTLPTTVGGFRRKELPSQATALKTRRMRLASIQESRRLAEESYHAIPGNQPVR